MTANLPEQDPAPVTANLPVEEHDVPSGSTGTQASETVLSKLEETKADDLTTATDAAGAPLSSPPPPAPQTVPLAQADEPADPRIAPLLAIFPDFDASLLSSVLDACDGNQDQAIETLLGMSDPSYVPQTAHVQSQTDLDEQLAHRLMLEEEENAARGDHGPPGQQQGQISVPYQPRQRAPRRDPPPQGGGYPVSTGFSGTGPAQGGAGAVPGNWGGVDTAQIQDQFSKIAETGKKTFSSFFSKVKQKMQELDKPHDETNPSADNQPVNASEWNQWAALTATPAPGPKEADDFTLPSAAPAGTKVQGYTVGHGPFQPPPHPPPKTTANLPRGGLTIREPASEPGYNSSTAIGPSGSSSPPPAHIDVSKINLMPKRPVSLVGASSSAPQKEDDDDLEYVENPFEDR